MRLNDQVLQLFMTTFYGSGNDQGDYWFVGMEEGGGNTMERVNTRIKAWKDLGETELVDIYDFHILINYPEYFNNPVKLQSIWKQQARIFLASKGLPTSTKDTRRYQRDVIGRKQSETCLLELLPLPSPGLSSWYYDRWTDISFLRNRKIYQNHYLPWRIQHIRSRIQEYQPKLVVFCGASYFKHWQKIARAYVRFQKQNGFWSARSGETIFIIVKHPAARGITNAYFEEIGRFVQTYG